MLHFSFYHFILNCQSKIELTKQIDSYLFPLFLFKKRKRKIVTYITPNCQNMLQKKVFNKICSGPLFCKNVTKIPLKLITAKMCPIKKNYSSLCTPLYFLLSIFSRSQFSSSLSLTFTSSSFYSYLLSSSTSKFCPSSLCHHVFKNHGKFLFFD